MAQDDALQTGTTLGKTPELHGTLQSDPDGSFHSQLNYRHYAKAAVSTEPYLPSRLC